MERSWQYDDDKVCHLLHSTVSSGKHQAGAPSLISAAIDCGKDCGCGATAQKIWIAADDTRMLDAIVIYNVLLSELRPKLGGNVEIATHFWRREMIAILELGAYLSANKIVQQIWVVAYNDDKGFAIVIYSSILYKIDRRDAFLAQKSTDLVLFHDHQITVDHDEGCLTWSVIYNAFLSELRHRLAEIAIDFHGQ